MNAGVDKGRAEMLACLAIGLCRNRDAAGDSNRLEAGGEIHVVPEHVVFVGHHVSHVDAHTELHDAVRGKLAVALGHQRLHRDRAFDGSHDARKLQHEAIAGVFYDTAAMIENDRVHRAAMGLEGGMRARLIGAHHSRIAGNVSANYGG